jgi:hypothetical protein
MKRTIALALGFLIVCAGLVAVSRKRDTTPADPPIPAPSHIDAEFDPEFRVMAISWDQRIGSEERPIRYRYRYRREGTPWSTWRTTAFPGIDLHRSHEREVIDVEVQTRTADSDRSPVAHARVAGRIPRTFDCRSHPYGAYPSKCVAGASPPMGD